jgi:GTP-binding protein YchF
VAEIGILGLPNVGKTTLFNALTGLEAPTAPHPYSTVEPHVGVARIPAPLLDRAAELEGSTKVVHATLQLLDLPAVAGPAHEGLGARFLGRLREVEALAVVLRAFEHEAVSAEESGIDPAEQAETLMLELAVADHEVFGRRSQKAAKEAAADPSMRPVVDAITRAAAMLDEGRPLREADWSAGECAAFRDLAPLTLKPAVWIVNVNEDEEDAGGKAAAIGDLVPNGDAVVVLSAEIEEEASRLDPEDRAELYEGLGLGEGALARVVQATYDALGLVSFFTLNANEAHAWTVRRGASAREAAGKVHSDLERGFIRAEVAPLEAVVEAGGWDALKGVGGVRVEGKDYLIADGEVLLIRFSV